MRTKFYDYWKGIDTPSRKLLASQLGTTIHVLRNIAYGVNGSDKGCSARYAVLIEKYTKGKVRAEDMCPDVDWQFIRNS